MDIVLSSPPLPRQLSGSTGCKARRQPTQVRGATSLAITLNPSLVVIIHALPYATRRWLLPRGSSLTNTITWFNPSSTKNV